MFGISFNAQSEKTEKYTQSAQHIVLPNNASAQINIKIFDFQPPIIDFSRIDKHIFTKVVEDEKILKAVGDREYLKTYREDQDGNIRANRVDFEPIVGRLVDVKSLPLYGKTIIVNAGHGYYKEENGEIAVDTGTKTNGKAPEWIVNYDNSMLLINRLRELGAKVIYIQGAMREQHNTVKIELEEMKEFGKINPDMFISLHINSLSDNTTHHGSEVFTTAISNDSSKTFRENIKSNLQKNGYKVASKSRDLGALNSSIENFDIPSVLFEYDFISSPVGREKVYNPDEREKYADVLTKSILSYFGVEE
ncbi:MAG: N-acetylmuramoyl-L-alanine amidase [bacterium]|nr:N-acetylmuramoyl-L-alanine amidase [bacterium]